MMQNPTSIAKQGIKTWTNQQPQPQLKLKLKRRKLNASTRYSNINSNSIHGHGHGTNCIIKSDCFNLHNIGTAGVLSYCKSREQIRNVIEKDASSRRLKKLSKNNHSTSSIQQIKIDTIFKQRNQKLKNHRFHTIDNPSAQPSQPHPSNPNSIINKNFNPYLSSYSLSKRSNKNNSRSKLNIKKQQKYKEQNLGRFQEKLKELMDDIEKIDGNEIDWERWANAQQDRDKEEKIFIQRMKNSSISIIERVLRRKTKENYRIFIAKIRTNL